MKKFNNFIYFCGDDCRLLQSRINILRYDTTNRGSDKSALADTSKRLQIAFGITFEN